MRKTGTEPTGQKRGGGNLQIMRWGWLYYKLDKWDEGPGDVDGISEQVRVVASTFLSQQLTEELRQELVKRHIASLVFHFGVHGKGWSKKLYPDINETLRRACARITDEWMLNGCGCTVHRKRTSVSCALAPDREQAKEIIAQLEKLGDTEEGVYSLIDLTDGAVPKEKPKGTKTEGEVISQPVNTGTGSAVSGQAHQFFHETMAEFAATAEATLIKLKPHLRTLLVTTPPSTYEGKRLLVDRLNKLFHAADMALKHPTRDEPVTLLALNGGPRSKKGYIQIRPTKGGDLLNLPDADLHLIRFHRYRESSSIPGTPAK